jgi:uncharacterized protein (TIGR00288 family)
MGNDMNDSGRTLAIFMDFENIALGYESSHPKGKFDIDRVLERLLEKGKVVTKKAYADWGRFRDYKHDLDQAGIELVEIPTRKPGGKNSADIRLSVDALELCYAKEHINTFVVVSGDSDFSPLVSQLKENGKYVLGLGMRDSTSDLLTHMCDEFIYYEDLVIPESQLPDLPDSVPPKKREAFKLLLDAVIALQREGIDLLLSSRVKDTIKRKRPSFTESSFGYRSFSHLLEDAEGLGIIGLEIEPKSRTYVVTDLRVSSRDRIRDTQSRKKPARRVPSRTKTKRSSSK